jgi:hypothetical protein
MYIETEIMALIAIIMIIVLLGLCVAIQDLDLDNIYLRAKVRKLVAQCKDYEKLITGDAELVDEFTNKELGPK